MTTIILHPEQIIILDKLIILKILLHGTHDQFVQIENYWLGFLKKQTSTVGSICASEAKP